MASVIKAGNATDGVQVTSDNTGILELKTGTGAGTTAMTVGTGQNVTFAQAANLPNTFGFKNRIINGAMVIDQRNAGASVTIASTGTFVVDRWEAVESSDGVATGEQVQDVPTGFTDSIKWTTTTADASLSASQYCRIGQVIEGYNIADLGWGSASASAITLSFWVRSSLTGTFAGGVRNSAGDRSYVFTYTINSANAWEQKTVTIAGDTSGTWLTTNGRGIWLIFDLGSGSDFQKTANAWGSGNCWSTSGSVSVIGTLNATWFITGVQLEKGSTATSFDYRPYSTELQLAQRYYYRVISQVGFGRFGSSFNSSTTAGIAIVPFPVSMRTNPSAIEQSGTAADYAVVHGITSTVCSAVPVFNSGTNSNNGAVTFTVASGLTAGQGSQFTSASGVTTAYLGWSAEL